MNIQNFYTYNEMLASGAQPTSGDISALKGNGFEVVVNFSPVSA